MRKTILGLDCSSTTIGWSLLSVENEVIKIDRYGNIKPPKKDSCSLVERLDSVQKEIDKLCIELKPDHIVIEDILKFMAGKTSADTIITLAIFNRTIALQVYQTLGKLPIFLLPISIRSRLKKFLSLENKIEKEQIPKILQDYFGKEFFKITGYKKRGKFKGQPIIEVYDESDACAAAWAGAIELKLV